MNMANFTHRVASKQKEHRGQPVITLHHDGHKFVPFHEQLLPHWRLYIKLMQKAVENGLDIFPYGSFTVFNIQIPKVSI